MNVGSQDINNQGFSDIKPPPPSGYHNPAKDGQEITMPKTRLDASEFLHQYLEEFSCLQPLVKGFLEIKPHPHPTLGNFLRPPHPVPKPFVNSKLNHKRIPSHHGYPEMVRKT